jgi:hypothetical protein
MSCIAVISRGKNKGNTCGKREFKEGFCKKHYKPEVEDNQHTCPFVMTRGNRKGECCNKKVKDGEEFCYSHSKITDYKKCMVILTRGTRKGQTCDKKCKDADMCSIHLKMSGIKSEAQTCEYIIKKGNNKGQKCKLKPKKNSQFCAKHSKTEAEPTEAEPTEAEEEDTDFLEFTIQLPKVYRSHKCPKNVDDKNIVFKQKEDLELEIAAPLELNLEKIRKKRKITDDLSVVFNQEEKKFSCKHNNGNYTLQELLFVIYYIYNLCTIGDNKYSFQVLTFKKQENVYKLVLDTN